MGTEFPKRGRARQVEALNASRSFVIDGFEIGVDYHLNSIVQTLRVSEKRRLQRPE
jgi:hypothetical protein